MGPLRPFSLALVGPTVASLVGGCGSPAPEPVEGGTPPTVVAPATTPSTVPPAKSPPDDGLINDDGHTLWASPTDGPALDASPLPDGCGFAAWFRPKSLLAREEGRRVLRALAPGDAPLGFSSDKPLEEIEHLLVAAAPGDSYGQVATAVAAEPTPTDTLPLLAREFEQLLETTDRTRHATLLFSPRFLLGDGGALLAGPLEPLRDLLLAQARDDWSAVAISLHLDDADRLYWELRVVAHAGEPETRTAVEVAEQATGWEDDLHGVVSAGDWSPYSRAVVERSPSMMRVVGKYARRGVEGRQAVVNGYAPPGAAHQLALAAERIVAELAAPIAPAGPYASDPELESETTAQRLRRPVTISFRRESLETAVAILSDTLHTPIAIEGRDLQLEGITRNQMLALDVSDKPAGDVLLDMLRQANPDPLAEGPADPRQKLVYVVSDQGVMVTTRAAAARRGDPLPAAFHP